MSENNIVEQEPLIEQIGKFFLTSRTLLVNIISLLAIGLQKWTGYEILPADIQLELVNLVNIILRFYTKDKLNLRP